MTVDVERVRGEARAVASWNFVIYDMPKIRDFDGTRLAHSLAAGSLALCDELDRTRGERQELANLAGTLERGLLNSAEEIVRLREQLREAREALEQLRHVWNAHMNGCTKDAALQAEIAKMPPLTAEDIQAWRNAPSDTASAEPSEKLAPENRTNLGGEWLR